MSFEDYLIKNGIKYQKNADCACLSSIRTGGKAKYLVFPVCAYELVSLIKECSRLGVKRSVIGALTNTLVAADYEGALISTSLMNKYEIDGSLVFAEAGVSLAYMIRRLAACGYELAPALSGIPGTLGGAVRNNVGAFSEAVSDFIERAYVYFEAEDKIRVLSRDELELSYRSSRLHKKDIFLLSAGLLIKRQDPSEIVRKISYYNEIRRQKQPSGFSLGSFFKNPTGLSAARLIDECALKGYRVGGAEVSRKHAGFIINEGCAAPDDVMELSDIVRKTVFRERGVRLEYEIEIIM